MILQVSNIIFVDQPIGTGFSYSSDKRDIRHDENGVSDDLYDFIQVCFVTFFSFYSPIEEHLVFVILLVSRNKIECDYIYLSGSDDMQAENWNWINCKKKEFRENRCQLNVKFPDPFPSIH